MTYLQSCMLKLGGEECAMVGSSGSNCITGGETRRGLIEEADRSTAQEESNHDCDSLKGIEYSSQ